MAASPTDPSSGPESFDPYRRRREIEAMEQRFRERAERHGGGPVATGEIDQRVADEMKEFFSESTEHAAKVVPNLDDASGSGMKETTGEIRRKIESFFAQVKDAGGGAATPNTQEIQSKRGRWQGYFPGGPGGAQDPAGAAIQNLPQVQPEPSDDDPPRPTLLRTRPPQTEPVTTSQIPKLSPSAIQQQQQQSQAPTGSQRWPAQPSYQQPPSQPVQQFRPAQEAPQASRPSPAAWSPPASPAPAAPAEGPGERTRMDLKSALEKLRRSGAGAGAPAPAASAAGDVAPPVRPEPPQRPTSLPPRPASMQPRPAALPPRPASPPAAATPFAPPPARHEPTVPIVLPAADREPEGAPATTSVPVVPPRRDAVRPVGAAAPQRPAEDAARDAGGRDAATEGRRMLRVPSAAAAHRAKTAPGRIPQRRDAAPPPVDRQIPKSPAASLPATDAAPRKADSPIRAVRREAVEPEAATPAPAPVDAKSLRGPSAAARSFAQSFRDPAATRSTEAPRDDAASRSAAPPRADAPPPAAARPAASAAPAAAPQKAAEADPASSFDDIFNELQGLVLETLKESVEESFESARDNASARGEAPADVAPSRMQPAPSRPAARAAPSPAPEPVSQPVSESDPEYDDAPADEPARGAVDPRGFSQVEEDDEGDAAPEAEAPAEPYNWGVRKAPRPQGAWLVEGEEAAAPAPARKPQVAASSAPVAPSFAAAPAPAPEPSAQSSMVGGRGYLQKKLGDEVRKFQPALDALKAKGYVSERDLADEDSPPRAPAGDAVSEEVSVESFQHRKPVDLDAELSPARLVEEIRRLRRLIETLVAKGVLNADDLQRPQ